MGGTGKSSRKWYQGAVTNGRKGIERVDDLCKESRMGYHKREISRGVFGKISKIREELEELEDSYDQGVRIMVLCELADLYGALEAFALTQGVTMNDVRMMSDRTKEAFSDGTRTSRSP